MNEYDDAIVEFEKTISQQDAINLFLDDLRESGECNMFGAAPYIMEEFALTKIHARAALKVWMDTYAERHGLGG